MAVAYNLLLNATTKMVSDEGITIDQFGSTDSERKVKYQDLLPNYLSLGDVVRNKIFSYKYFQSDSAWLSRNNRYILDNGMELVIAGYPGSCIQNMALNQKGCSEYDTTCSHSQPNMFYGTYQHGCADIYVDINGYKNGPNMFYKDVFVFVLVKDGIVPLGSSKETVWTQTFESGNTFTAWVLYNKNMDYLRCKDKLGWNKAKSCKD